MGIRSLFNDLFSSKDLTVVTFGDSLTYRYEDQSSPVLTQKLSQLIPELNWINAGVSGDDILMAKKRYKNDVLSHHPDVVTFLFGTNDSSFHHNVPIESFKQTLLEMLDLLGDERAILITPPPVDEKKQVGKRTNERIQRYRKVILDIGKIRKIPVIDLYEEFITHPNFPEILKGNLDDGLHFGEAGYNLYAAAIAKCLKENFLAE
ncbi:esterase [Atopobacter sp. AH10]|uniref:GDSL-type esterase/lipase family protein n=1 Tax=Atopobacter sp. AH10 TaxID=2315861 RepID=UPI000EF27D76|nr:GDSL-type esterase/lipase family protein [Atopobacter sp. AH10]RLK62978.1 esterase [Atopobacter sp. AH10]